MSTPKLSEDQDPNAIKTLLRSDKISIGAKYFALFLADHGPDGSRHVPLAGWAMLLGCSKSAVSKWSLELEKVGFIRREMEGVRGSLHVRLIVM